MQPRVAATAPKPHSVGGGVLLVSALERELFPFRGRPGAFDLTRLRDEPKQWWGGWDDTTEIVATAGGVGRAKSQAAAAIGIARYRPSLVVSVGYCGGLDPALEVGDVVTADFVRDPDGNRYPARPLGSPAVTVFTADRVLPTAAEKADLFAATGAAVVDMEASGVAHACREAGVPFAAVKVVTDAAGDELPAGLEPFLEFVDGDGGNPLLILPCVWAIARRPSLIRDLLRLSRASRVCGMNLALFLHDEVRVRESLNLSHRTGG